ncbi:hypothetical protein IAT38_004351 [Cryptococcus sp. DSM 104549]
MSNNPDPLGRPPAYNEHYVAPTQLDLLTLPEPTSSRRTPRRLPRANTHSFACLHMQYSDTLRLIGVTHKVCEEVDRAIVRGWGNGIQRKKQLEGAFEWKLWGHPWPITNIDPVPTRRLLLFILRALSTNGWELHTATFLSTLVYDRNSLILRSCPPRDRSFFVIHFTRGDKVRLIDHPDDGVQDAFEEAMKTWPAGIQYKGPEGGCYKVKLKGNPWSPPPGIETTQARVLACTLLAKMEEVGYELVGSVDVNSDQRLDTWIFANMLG